MGKNRSRKEKHSNDFKQIRPGIKESKRKEGNDGKIYAIAKRIFLN